MASKFFFSLNSIKPLNTSDGGSLTHVTAKETPGLVNMAFGNLKLNKRGSLEPIWHPNSHKVGYCTQGKVFVAMRSPGTSEKFTVQSGEMFFIPKGYVHHIENIAWEESVIHFAFDNANPDTMCLSKSIYTLNDSVFNATFNTQPGYVDGLKKTKSDSLLKVLPEVKKDPGAVVNQYKFNIGDSTKPILTKGGYLQIGTKSSLPVLEGLGVLGFGLNQKGVVEPHWHTNAGELVYIVKGKTRITVLTPDGTVESQEVAAGEGAFAPASYFHNIENIGTEDVDVIAFFNHEAPDYIGISEVVGTFSTDVLASVFNISPIYFDSFIKQTNPLVIVPT